MEVSGIVEGVFLCRCVSVSACHCVSVMSVCVTVWVCGWLCAGECMRECACVIVGECVRVRGCMQCEYGGCFRVCGTYVNECACCHCVCLGWGWRSL